jgi:predicted HTH transcriptional regulator
MNTHMKPHKIKLKIVDFISESRAVTTSEVASKFKKSWNTAEKYMLELALDGKIIRLKKSGVNIWLIK